MYQPLQQLKELVFSRGFDEESRQDVLNFEKQLHELAVKEHLAEDPVIGQYIAYLQAEIDRAETLLKTDKTLTDRQRDELFTRIELADRFTSLFNGKRRQEVEQTINELLNAAKNR